MNYNPGFGRWLLMQSFSEQLQSILKLIQLNGEFADTLRLVAERDAIELHRRARFGRRCRDRNRHPTANRQQPKLETNFLSDISLDNLYSRSKNPARVD